MRSKIIMALILGILLGNIMAVSSSIIINYAPKEGFALANGKLMGGDFIAFYTAGKLARIDLPNLYDFNIQKKIRTQILQEDADSLKGELPFVYPPLVAWFFSWLALFDFDKSFYLWSILSVVISIFSLLLLSSWLGILNAKSIVFILLGTFGFIPYFINCLAGGQLAAIGIFIFSLLFILLKEKREFLAGIVLSFGYYKPPLFLFLSIVLLISRGKYFFFRVSCRRHYTN